MRVSDQIIVALDVESRTRAMEFVRMLYPSVKFFKVGSQLFTACGPDLVREIIGSGGKVFLDLKFHDIPQTVTRAVLEAAKLNVDMINVHALGGAAMMRAASEALAKNHLSKQPSLIAVTMLTSMGEVDAREIGFSLPIADQSVRLAVMAQNAGLDGVVASPLEVSAIRRACGPHFLIVVPGIRPPQTSADDQVRVATPAAALEAGADYLVIGRPILDAQDPLEALQQIYHSVDNPSARA